MVQLASEVILTVDSVYQLVYPYLARASLDHPNKWDQFEPCDCSINDAYGVRNGKVDETNVPFDLFQHL